MFKLNNALTAKLRFLPLEVGVRATYEDMAVGAFVKCVGVDPRHKHWDFNEGHVYKVAHNRHGNIGVQDGEGDVTPVNWGFLFEEIYICATEVPELVECGTKLRYLDSAVPDGWSRNWLHEAGCSLGAVVTVRHKLDEDVVYLDESGVYVIPLDHLFLRVDQAVVDVLKTRGDVLLEKLEEEEEVVEQAPFKAGDKVRVKDFGAGFSRKEVGYVVTVTEVAKGKYLGDDWAFRIAEEYAGNNSPRCLDGWHGASHVELILGECEPDQDKTCRDLGYKIGDKFVVIFENMFKLGSVVELERDDGTSCPRFKLVCGECYGSDEQGAYTFLHRVAKITDVQLAKILAQQEVKQPEVAPSAEADTEASVERLTREKLKFGQLYVVVEEGTFSAGSIVELERDDGTSSPLFKLVRGSCRYNNAAGRKPGGFEQVDYLAEWDEGAELKAAAQAVTDAMAALTAATDRLLKLKATV